MKKKDPLGQFEQLVLTAVLLLRDNAYGMAVADKVAELAERRVTLGAVYMTLERLEDKCFISSCLANPTPERGGREKRYFRLLALGERVLAESRATAKRMEDALEESEKLAKWRPSRAKLEVGHLS
jgi:DNA-binding PadR family transcriptional regulator